MGLRYSDTTAPRPQTTDASLLSVLREFAVCCGEAADRRDPEKEELPGIGNIQAVSRN